MATATDDPPVLEICFETNEPLIFRQSTSPFWIPNPIIIIIMSIGGRVCQNLWMRTPLIPAAGRTYRNISSFSHPIRDLKLTGKQFFEWTIGLDIPDVSILAI
jgi:hypothetical protein